MMIFTPTLTVEDLLKGDIQLASPPSVYMALKQIVDDPTRTLLDAAKVIETDASLSLRLLKIVNSAFYGFSGQISAIAKAISLIGIRELQNLMLATTVIERFSELPGQLISMQDFWAKNLRCALIARELDARTGKQYADSAFLCGLVHNIGQLVFYRRIPLLAREVDLLKRVQIDHPVDEAAIETQVIGFDRYQLAASLCRLWQLPEAVIESIRLHRYPDNQGPYAELARLVRLADQLSQTEKNRADAHLADAEQYAAEWLAEVLDKTQAEFDAIFKLFYPQR